MSLEDHKRIGMFSWPYNESGEKPLLMVLMVFERSIEGDLGVETLYNVVAKDIREASERYGFDFEEVLNYITNSDSNIHTFLIDMDLYRRGRENNA